MFQKFKMLSSLLVIFLVISSEALPVGDDNKGSFVVEVVSSSKFVNSIDDFKAANPDFQIVELNADPVNKTGRSGIFQVALKTYSIGGRQSGMAEFSKFLTLNL